jgi:AAA family ATP:ADP antiporter
MLFFKDSLYIQAMGIPILAAAVYFGAISHIFARATKHTIFDATKEMVYIPLDDDLKTKGKAAAETVGARFGKGAGAFIQQLLLVALPGLTLLDLAPIISGIFLVILLWWVYSVFVLNKHILAKV